MQSDATFHTISPVDGSVLVERSYARESEITDTLFAARRAQQMWKHTKLEDRAEFCKKVVAYFLNHADEIGSEITRQMGRPVRYAPSEITGGFQERALHMIGIAAESLKKIKIPEKTGFIRYIKREPLGTVLVLAPWNYPFLTSVNAIIPAIMAGNSVILKHATQTPLCAERYAAAFEYANAPKGLFQFLHLTHNQVSKMIASPGIDFVAFTGSVAGGHAVVQSSGNRFINAGLELGGKDPAYVRPDAQLEHAIENLVDGAFFNSGQSCCGIERIYVHKDVYKDFVEGFVSLTRTYHLDDPLLPETTLGPMVKTSAARFVHSQIQKAVMAGAEALIDPAIFERHKEGTPYMAPQVLVNVDHGMEVMKEETFGPVVGIMPVQNDEEAVRLMNDSEYGLTASIWADDIQKGTSLGDQLDTGTVYMNRCDYLDPALAWTGVKNSGRGCTLSSLGYEVLTRPKSYHLKIV